MRKSISLSEITDREAVGLEFIAGKVDDRMTAAFTNIYCTRECYDEVVIFFSSTGGSVSALENILFLIKQIKASGIKLTFINTGCSHSSASIIFLEGDTRVALPESSFMFHKTSLVISEADVIGETELGDYYKDINKYNKKFLSRYKDLKLTKAQWEVLNSGNDLELDVKQAMKAKILTHNLRGDA